MWDIRPETLDTKAEECLGYIKDNWEKIPVLNCFTTYNEGQLVRFTGMIQDMPNPIYYYSSYEVINNTTGIKEVRSGRYRDFISCDEDETLLLDSINVSNDEKRLFRCISVPGLNDWVQPCWTSLESRISENVPSTSNVKRSVDEMELDEDPISRNKRLCTNPPNNVITHKPLGNQDNFPISNANNFACIINTYEYGAKEIKVNDIVESCGFVHYNKLSQDSDSPHANTPRLHAILFRVKRSLNPYRNVNLKPEPILLEAKNIRSELQLVLTQLLLGDSLTADYLICNLISRVHQRKQNTILGKLCLNISNIPLEHNYIDRLYSVLSQLLPKTHYLPLSLDLMNRVEMVPKKNYDVDRLDTGLLQLSNRTHLIIDETKLAAGSLGEKGVKNVQALKCLIENQKLDYDFKFFPVDFECDIPVIILSEGKSVLSSDIHIVLKPEPEYSISLDDSASAVEKYLQPSLLVKIRDYIEVLSLLEEYQVPDTLQEILPDDLVSQRYPWEKSSAEDFHARLVLARLLSYSFGATELTKEAWNKSGIMERSRKLRLNLKK